MDKYYSWKKTLDIEIDVADLFRSICRQWKQIAVCALVSALIFGGYGWQKSRRSSVEADASGTEAEAVLTEEEEQYVMDAVRLEKEIRNHEEYLENSILMQLDSYHKTRYIMLYCIYGAKSQELAAVTEGYLNFILNGGAAYALRESDRKWDLDKRYLAEVIRAYEKIYDFPYQPDSQRQSDSSQTAESLFYLEVTGRNAQEAKKMAEDMQEVLQKHSAYVNKQAGIHKLKLVSSEECVTADSVLQLQQNDKRNLLSSNRTSLKTMTDAFSTGQMVKYKESIGREEKEMSDDDTDVIHEFSGPGIRYIFLGLIAGIFAYGCIFSVCYLLNDKVKSVEEMKKLYTFPLYGIIAAKENSRIMHGLQKESAEQMKAQAVNRIRLACQKQGITKLQAVSDFDFQRQEKECLENFSQQLKCWGIELKAVENARVNTEVWDELAKTGNVLMVCRIGTTTHHMIDDAMSFYLENDITVTGTAVFAVRG